MGTTKARRRERYAQDPDYRARQSAYARAYYQAHKREINERRRAYSNFHKQEINERKRAYYHSHKQDIKPSLRRGQLKRQYGLSPADYDALLAQQNGVCATCGKPSEETLCVDHCHETGTVRGLLCRQCNFALGCFRDSQAAMMAAIAYLGGSKDDRPGAAAQRALAARAMLTPGRAGVTLRVETRSFCGLDADRAPAGDRLTKPMRNALEDQLQREGDDGEGGTASLLRLIARKLVAEALAGDLEAIREIFDRMDGASVAAATADAPHLLTPGGQPGG
jgi:Recombination endonuclease VII